MLSKKRSVVRCFEYLGEMIHQSQLTTNVAENPSDVLQAANLHVFKGGTERPHFQLRNLEQGPFHRPSKFETAPIKLANFKLNAAADSES